MPVVNAKNGRVTVTDYRGDAKTLIVFDLLTEAAGDRLAGFSVQIAPPGKDSYYLQNDLRLEHPGDYAQVPTESDFSTVNALIHRGPIAAGFWRPSGVVS